VNTKAQILNTLRTHVNSAEILDLIFFRVKKWKEDKNKCLDEITKKFGIRDLFIVRSSSTSEDQSNESGAGKYESVLNVKISDLEGAIERVIDSFDDVVSLNDEILIQPMLTDVAMSGVLFTQDPTTGAPYYVLNYHKGNNTAAVTSGSEKIITHIIARTYKKIQNPCIEKLIVLSKELEHIMKNEALDIEFAFDKENKLYLFQVRFLVLKKFFKDFNQDYNFSLITTKIDNLNACYPNLHGKKTILGIMPDWNPAEMIGIRPKSLALSLYKELITDRVWAYQRDNYGYKDLKNFPLLVDLGGLPYIDVRVSFNSFLPKSLPPVLSEKLVNYYLHRLEKNPELHDKVEFDIIFSCYDFSVEKNLARLLNHGFVLEEIKVIKKALLELTNGIINEKNGLWKKDIQQIEQLADLHNKTLYNNNLDDISKIYWLVEYCKRYGTLPFAGLARTGFMAIQFLNSMAAIGIISLKEKFAFLNSLDSVSSVMMDDIATLDKVSFLQKYGHLRPGTYDILSARYDEAVGDYFDWDFLKQKQKQPRQKFKLTLLQINKIEQELKKHALDIGASDFFDFLKLTIEAREYSKFLFTKTLSDILLLVKNLGKKHTLSVQDMAYIDIKDVLKVYSSSCGERSEILNSIQQGKQKHEIARKIILPPIITKTDDVFSFKVPDSRPNFITHKTITGKVVVDLKDTKKMMGAIVCIPSADPGYDWIFTHNIAGFITAYGGSNSHMAIRAGELGLPAVIGAGEQLYKQWSNAEKVYMDCMNHQVKVLH
jgi:glutamine kinase